jgi:hypothetical protein
MNNANAYINYMKVEYDKNFIFMSSTASNSNRAGIAQTCYGLEGPEFESRWGEIFRNRPDRPWGPPSLLYNG